MFGTFAVFEQGTFRPCVEVIIYFSQSTPPHARLVLQIQGRQRRATPGVGSRVSVSWEQCIGKAAADTESPGWEGWRIGGPGHLGTVYP